MNPVTDNSITEQVMAQINGRANDVSKDKNSLGQEDFLSLMIAQVRSQDPFEPMKNGEFIAQMAQFATVDGVNNMQASLADLSKSLNSSQALAAADLVGRSVLSAVDSVQLQAQGSISGVIAGIPDATSLTLDIFDASGTLTARRVINPRATGNTPFVWDGLNDAGQRVAPGSYRLAAQALVDGENFAVETRMRQRIDSVTFGAGLADLGLNLEDGSRVAFSAVQEIL